MATHAPITGAPTRASSNIIPFPADRIFRSQELLTAIRQLAYCDESVLAEGDDLTSVAKRIIGNRMRDHWESEVQRLGGMPKAFLKRDGVDQ